MKTKARLFCATLAACAAMLVPSTALAVCIIEYGDLKVFHIKLLWGLIDPVDEAYFYSDEVNADTGFLPEVSGDTGIGDWGHQFITQDHNGAMLSGIGVRFYLKSGDGISEGESADFKFLAVNDNSAQWYATYHDSASNLWIGPGACAECPEPVSIALLFAGLAGLGRRFRVGRHTPVRVSG
ncbi:hypothetical protein OPU71_13405 [Niveibacterium sp. 24ML]|uniref:hypothetical protein n=1 Tax=Niveibacterium sp. 24ML TaxID=2985512 RepID=UPI00226EB8BC|nr:hypothetical protein [Niveibacterium sp. 24ML]MCX9157124.1 hypothetical protein [Niveibacterium sp. 24ML]